MEEDEDAAEESSNTQTDVTRCVTWRFDRALQMPFLKEKFLSWASQILELCISNVIFSYYVEKIFAS